MAVETVRVEVRLTSAPDDTAAPQWTVGPWSLDDDGDLTPIAKDPSAGLWGFVPLFDGTNADNPEAAANMKLIAAAPSLYEALSRLVARYHPYRDNHDDSDWASAVAALALARGETK